ALVSPCRRAADWANTRNGRAVWGRDASVERALVYASGKGLLAMRNKILLLGIPLAVACLVASAAQAAMRTDYDPVAKKWITYDTKSDGFYHGGGSSVPRELVRYDGPYGANTIVINTDE